MVSTANFWLNVYPPKDGVSRNINPRELITGTKIDYNKHIRAEFGEYVQVHEEHDNTMKTRTTGAIATKPTGNAQGGHWFYSLTTGRMLDRTKWTPLPMPADVIERVNVLAKASPVGMNFTNMRNEEYDDHDDESAGDDDSDADDSDYDADDDSSDGDDDDYDDFIAGVNGDQSVEDDGEDVDETFNNDENKDDDPEDDDDDPEDDDDASEDTNEDQDGDEKEIVTLPLKKLTDDTGALPPVIQSRTRQQAHEAGENLFVGVLTKKQRKAEKKLAIQMIKRAEAESQKKLKNKKKNEKRKLKQKKQSEDTADSETKKNEDPADSSEPDEFGDLRPIAAPTTNGGTTGATRVTTVLEDDEDEDSDEPDEFGDLRDQLRSEQKPGTIFPDDKCSSKGLTPDLEAIALTQYTLKRGLKEFGSDGLVALGKEVEQLHARKVGKPVDGNNLTRDEKRATLRYLMFLSKKRCGRIKARGCADGRKQRLTTNKEDASAPTVSIEAVMLSATIDALEGRDVATVDIPGAFMQADIDEVVHVKFEGEMAEMLVKLDPKLYRKYVKNENGKSVLYVELLKALYGTLKAALLFWKLL
jgi:hypothetical protein